MILRTLVWNVKKQKHIFNKLSIDDYISNIEKDVKSTKKEISTFESKLEKRNFILGKPSWVKWFKDRRFIADREGFIDECIDAIKSVNKYRKFKTYVGTVGFDLEIVNSKKHEVSQVTMGFNILHAPKVLYIDYGANMAEIEHPKNYKKLIEKEKADKKDDNDMIITRKQLQNVADMNNRTYKFVSDDLKPTYQERQSVRLHKIFKNALGKNAKKYNLIGKFENINPEYFTCDLYVDMRQDEMIGKFGIEAIE